MNHMSSQSSKQVAIHNYQDCVQHIPNRLVKREKHFLKIVKKHNDDPFRALHKLFYFMDNLFDFVRPYTPCKKGCTLCCAIPISISELEIQMIEKATLTKRISIPAALVPQSQCPFLEGGSCSIYRYRPFVCRRNVTFADTPKWCHIETGKHVGMPMICFSKIDASYRHILERGGFDHFYDIRVPFGYKRISNNSWTSV